MSFGITGKRGNDERPTSMNGERYVYYERLLTDNQGKLAGLYTKATSVLDYRIEEGSSTEKIAKYFYSLRDGEYKKEVKLLSDVFGRQITSSYEDKNNSTGKDLINSFNAVLSLEDVYKRNLALITDTKGQRSLIVSFYSYFDKKWKEGLQKTINDIKNHRDFNENIDEAINEVLGIRVYEVAKEALLYMFTEAKSEAGITTEYVDAYKELAGPLQNLQNSAAANEFLKGMIKSYKLDEAAKEIKELLKEHGSYVAALKKYSTDKGLHGNASRGGEAAEHLGNYIASLVTESFGGKSYHTGSTKIKADWQLTFNLPDTLIPDWLEDNDFGTRPKNILASQDLQQALSRFNEGFIVYSNAKNYTLNQNFKGYAAGEAINLNTWDDMMSAMNKKGRDLIFSVMQLIPGAIGEGKDEEVNRMFARAIASALFDDFNVVGLEEKSVPNSIHLLYLNGLYFPLSFYYDLLGKAFENYSAEEATKLLRVSIKRPESIKYQSLAEERADRADGKSPWAEQQKVAMKETTIQYHFLQAYQKIMRDIFKPS